MPAVPALSPVELAAITDPAKLLDHAWAMEPQMRLQERYAALDRLDQLLRESPEIPATPDRSWELELIAERAIDDSVNLRLDEAETRAARVLREAQSSHRVARARALLAQGRALAWRGTEATNREADRVLMHAAEAFAELEHREWQGLTLYWCGYSVHFQTGNLPRAAELMHEALEIMGPDSPRRPTILVFYADALIELGDWEAATDALAEAGTLADRYEDRKARAFCAWSLARIESLRGDPFATERRLREVERDGTDWFDTHIGLAFLTDAVEYLDRVGLSDEAAGYLARAVQRSSDDESVRQAQATMLARSGDPQEALDALQDLARGDWLEKRLVWRNTLLAAWATFRSGRSDAGELAARSFDQAVSCGGMRVAVAGERELTLALAPLAERTGSPHARALLLDGRSILISLFGTPSVLRADGSSIELPAGKPGELVRMLAIHEHGLQVEMVCDAFFPDASPRAARQRLRQILTRLRAAAGDLVVRDGNILRLIPAWVDLREFVTSSERLRSVRGPRAVQHAYAALALWSGPLLPGDLYAEWADETRKHAEYRHLQLLDLIVADAVSRRSHQEALTALDAAMQVDPFEISRYSAIIDQLVALGQQGTARYVADQVGIELEDRVMFGQEPTRLRARG